MESTLLPSATASAPVAPAGPDSPHDFDFLFGSWRIVNHRLVRRLAGCTDWETFWARQKAWPILGGLGNMDEFRPEARQPGFVGLTLRLFNPATHRWSIYWMDNQSVTLEPPVTGGWLGDTGHFSGPDVFDGKPITVRFTWQRLGPDTARWEQEFSPDHGLTWEKNWIMEFTREEK